MSPRRAVAALAAAIVVLVAGCSDGQVQRSDNGDQAGYISGDGAITTIPVGEREPAPDFSGPLLDGGEFNLADARGDIVVLNVWGSWCPPCREEAPALQAVYESIADQGVRFIGVDIRDTKTAARAFQDEFGITYPSVFDPDGSHLLAFRETLPPSAVPTTLVIDRDGRMAARLLGAITETTLRDLISDVLAEDVQASPEPPAHVSGGAQSAMFRWSAPASRARLMETPPPVGWRENSVSEFTGRKRDALNRLKTVRGHLDGIVRMLESDAYCIDVMKQISAVQSSLERANRVMLHNHLETCFAEAVVTGAGQAAIQELVDAVKFTPVLTGPDARLSGEATIEPSTPETTGR